MSSTNTNYIVTNTNGSTDLINIFQINPNNTNGVAILPPPFTTTGSPFIEYNSGYYILKYTTNGTFNSNSITSLGTINVLIVGGGGSGGGSSSSGSDSASGGNGGSVIYFDFTPTNTLSLLNINIGSGGAGVVSNTPGNPGSNSVISSNDFTINVTAPAGNGGYSGAYWPTPQPSATISLSGTYNIYYQTPVNTITGGNANLSSTTTGISTAGNNGYGTFIPNNSINLKYLGGGGGGSGAYVGGTFGFTNSGNGGLGGGGNGGYNSGVSPYPFVSVGNGINGTGGGGGGSATYTGSTSGSGGSGVVILWFKYSN